MSSSQRKNRWAFLSLFVLCLPLMSVVRNNPFKIKNDNCSLLRFIMYYKTKSGAQNTLDILFVSKFR